MIVDRIILSSQFIKVLKKINKRHQTRTINEIIDKCKKLMNGEIETQSDNHSLNKSYKGAVGLNDLHIDGGNYILLYRYKGDTLIVSLELNNLVTHDELDRKMSKKVQSNATHKVYDAVSDNIFDYIDKPPDYTEGLDEDIYEITWD